MKQKRSFSIRWSDVVLLVLAALFCAGILSLFAPCGAKEDGSWMTCHWAGQALTGAAFGLLILAALRLFVSPAARIGLDFGSIVLSALAYCLPGGLVSLCMMDTMRCHALMQPAARILSALTAVAAVADLLLRRKEGKQL